MLNEVKDFKKYLTRIEKAENTIEKYVRDLENMYEHMKRQKEYCRGELASPSINKESILKYKEHLDVYDRHYKYALNKQNGDAELNREYLLIGY